MPERMPRRHPNQMPEPPQLPPFDAQEQQLYSELPSDVQAPDPIFKTASRWRVVCIRNLILLFTTQSS